MKRRDQQGSTLVIVLVVLLLVIIIGTLAIRQSISSLKLVTNNQIQTLLLQSSDAALLALQNPNNTPDIAAANGIVGFFRNEDNYDKELILCFRGDQPFSLSNASWLYWHNATPQRQKMATQGGACSDDDKDVAGRKAVVTQIHIKRATGSSTQPFADLARGTDAVNAKTEQSLRLQVYVTSVMKGLATSKSDLFDSRNGCLNQSIAPPVGVQGLIACLKEKKVLYSTQVAEYRFLSDFEPSGS
ncbi:pilus assembly protein PilX [Acinetobacter haemolyticus]|uniref:pilus assembly protein PilX n=1 Tax=Acinetobacter haemolyticus TaxID=29430 RepID=UPI0021CD2B46|nr:pilus assembly protein PilX [Acinetobacter haemolyticus]MCU4378597.1 pilus assembly protein PilX [Acinetobacter haemolyticus]